MDAIAERKEPKGKSVSKFDRAADGSMSLMEHLRELRSRLLKACLAILFGTVVGYFLAPYIRHFLDLPYCNLEKANAIKTHTPLLNGRCNLIQTEIGSTFILQMKISMWAGLAITAPVWMYQLWAFIAPGLHRHERRWAYLFGALAGPLFAGGAVLAYVVIARGLSFLFHYAGSDVTVLLDVNNYIGFITGMMLIFGVAFEFPLGIMLANVAGVVSGRKLLGWWRPAIFIFFVFAAVATPTADPFGMSFLAVAMSVLYFGAVGFAFLNDRRRNRRRPAYANVGDDEVSSLDNYTPDPVEAATPIDTWDPIAQPTPVARPLPIDRGYDDIT